MVFMSPYVSLLTAIAWVHNPTVIGSGKAHKNSVHIVVIAVMHWWLRAETHTCGNIVSTAMFCLWAAMAWTVWSRDVR